MKRVIIVGSPRANGRSAHLAEMLFEANIDERPEDELYLVPVSEIDVGPCVGCGACKEPSPVTFKDDEGNEVTELRNRCIFDDDMQTLYDLLDECDELTIVCPVYFSGAPAPMKCVLDRLQPYFWPYCANGPREPKRPLQLHVLGEGGDPHGYAPLVSEVKGSTALAGFRLERIMDWVGKISPQGEILEEATEVAPSLFAPQQAAAGGQAGADMAASAPVSDSDDEPGQRPADAGAAPAERKKKTPRPAGERPKLKFSAEPAGRAGKARQASGASPAGGRGQQKAAGKQGNRKAGKGPGTGADRGQGAGRGGKQTRGGKGQRRG